MPAPLRRLAPVLGAALLAAAGAWFLRDGSGPAPEVPAPGRDLGRKKLQSFCLSCHTLDGPATRNPLAPKVRGWTRDQAYANVGRLDRLNPAMILSFEGTDEERWALAGALERLGAGRTP